jgi:glycosyltransferase involved in cell wall biosynthesis
MINNNVKVSILIPVYNRKNFIAECIQSALNQTYPDFEIVVVDNASDDGTWEICQFFSNLDRRVRIFRNETNIGPVRNWIRCAEEAVGALSKILFSDDCLEPNCLNEMVPKLDDSEVALVYCAARIGKSRDESVVAYSQVDSSRLNSTQFLNCIISGAAPVSPGAVLIRTHDLLKNLHTTFPTFTPRQFDKNGAGPDVMISLLTARDYLYVANISTPLVFFRAHAGSFSIENSNNDVVKCYQSVISLFLIKHHSHKLWLDYLAQTWLQQVRFTGRWRSPFSHLLEFEGVGTLSESITMMLLVTRHIANAINRNLMKSIGRHSTNPRLEDLN